MREKPSVNNVAETAFRRHYTQIYRYVRRRTQDHHRAEELTQQVFADASESLRPTGGPPLAWLYTVAKRRFADEARRSADAVGFDPPAQPQYGNDVRDALSAALAELSEGQRQVLVLKLLRGVSFAEVAELLGVTEAAAKMRFARAGVDARAPGGKGDHAMTIHDPEVVELLRDQPELLALADAVAETQSRPRRVALRATPLRAGAVLAVAAAALLAVLFWPGGGGRTHGLLGRALAAIGDGRVMHVVLQTPSGYQLVELKGGRTITPTDNVEIWSDRSSKRWHSITRGQGRIVSEWLSPEDDHGVGMPDPALTAFWTGYRKALADGTAKLVGDGTVYGHRIYWLQFPLPDQGGPGSRVAVDQDSYRPVAVYMGMPAERGSCASACCTHTRSRSPIPPSGDEPRVSARANAGRACTQTPRSARSVWESHG